MATDFQRQRLDTLLIRLEVVPDATNFKQPVDIDLHEKDLPIFLAAVGTKASYLTTGDKAHFGQYFGQELNGMLIQPPADYFQDRANKSHVDPPTK